jgi:hypothetical protein
MSTGWIIRKEIEFDYEAIDRVVAAASGDHEDVVLVRKLRTDGAALLSLS